MHPTRTVIIVLTVAMATGAVCAAGSGDAAVAAYLAKHRTQVSYHAVRLSDGAVLGSRDAGRLMLPASVQKICTAAIALETLGADFQFRTRLAVSGDDVVVIGDGDPIFGDPAVAAAAEQTIYHTLDAWAQVLAQRGLTEIAGDVVVDDDIFQERRHRDWPQSDHPRWFAAPVSGLSFNDNCLDIRIVKTPPTPTLHISPVTNRLHIVNGLAIGRKQVWRVLYAEADAVVEIRGTVNTTMDSPMSVAVNEPALLLGRVFADRLEGAGLPVAGSVIRRQVARKDRSLPESVTVVAEHATALPAVLARANKRSLNLVAECLLLRSAVARRGAGTWAAAAEVGREVLTGTYGLSADQFTIADGSGLSRSNRLTAGGAVALLAGMAARPDGPVFIDSLAVAGTDGTLAKRLTQLRGRVRAKTGTLTGTVGLAGYIVDEQGRPTVAMAIFCNRVRGGNALARRMMDALVTDWAGRK